MKTKHRRIETKTNDGPSIYVLLYVNAPIYSVYGAYKTESKLIAALKALAKLPENRLSRAQKKANTKARNKKLPLPFPDPMDFYSIREVTVL